MRHVRLDTLRSEKVTSRWPVAPWVPTYTVVSAEHRLAARLDEDDEDDEDEEVAATCELPHAPSARAASSAAMDERHIG
jgi:hypothetical protein